MHIIENIGLYKEILILTGFVVYLIFMLAVLQWTVEKVGVFLRVDEGKDKNI